VLITSNMHNPETKGKEEYVLVLSHWPITLTIWVKLASLTDTLSYSFTWKSNHWSFNI
jgi:hypothetical protein